MCWEEVEFRNCQFQVEIAQLLIMEKNAKVLTKELEQFGLRHNSVGCGISPCVGNQQRRSKYRYLTSLNGIIHQRVGSVCSRGSMELGRAGWEGRDATSSWKSCAVLSVLGSPREQLD